MVSKVLCGQRSTHKFFFPSIIHFYSPFLHKFEPYPGGGGGGGGGVCVCGVCLCEGGGVDNPPSGAYVDGRYIGIQLNS